MWDKFIIQKLRGYKRPRDNQPFNEYDKELSFEWAQDLKEKIDRGNIDVSKECTDISKAQKCALKWASEANAHVCSYVLKDVGFSTGPDGCEKCCKWDWQGPEDLSQEYYEKAVPIVEKQVGKAGWRLGQWINALAAQRASMREAGMLRMQQPKEEM